MIYIHKKLADSGPERQAVKLHRPPVQFQLSLKSLESQDWKLWGGNGIADGRNVTVVLHRQAVIRDVTVWREGSPSRSRVIPDTDSPSPVGNHEEATASPPESAKETKTKCCPWLSKAFKFLDAPGIPLAPTKWPQCHRHPSPNKAEQMPLNCLFQRIPFALLCSTQAFHFPPFGFQGPVLPLRVTWADLQISTRCQL